MTLQGLAKAFFSAIEKELGPFDEPFQFHVFPFSAGGNLNFFTVGRGKPFVTYVSCDLFEHPEQKRGSLGRYELLAVCDDEKWCNDILSDIGRQGLHEVFLPGDTLDIAALVDPDAALQGVVFEEAFYTTIGRFPKNEKASLLRCIGVTRNELAYARKHGVAALVKRLKAAKIYPGTIVNRDSVDLA